MEVYFATDHAGFTLKEDLVRYVRDELGHEVMDCGAVSLNPDDDYVPFVQTAARAVAAKPQHCRAIILGGSGQGEAMAANRFKGVRAAVYYGAPNTQQVDAEGQSLPIIDSVRKHNDANVLSLGARFIACAEAKEVVKRWLETPFSNADRHHRRISQLDEIS